MKTSSIFHKQNFKKIKASTIPCAHVYVLSLLKLALCDLKTKISAYDVKSTIIVYKKYVSCKRRT